MIKMEDTTKPKMVINQQPEEDVEEDEEEIQNLFLGLMESYNDPVISPLSYFSPLKKDNIASSKENNPRKRARTDNPASKKMTKSFSLLDSMVPKLYKSYKRTQEKIILDTVEYINLLEEEIARLEAKKTSQLQETALTNPAESECTSQDSVGTTVSSNHATFLAIQRPQRPALLQDIVQVLVKHGANVLEARVSVSDKKILTFTATVTLGTNGQISTIEQMKEEISCL